MLAQSRNVPFWVTGNPPAYLLRVRCCGYWSGAQRIGGEELLPAPGREQPDLGGRVLAHALEHIDQIVVGVDLVQAAGDDQALQHADIAGADLAPGEEPVFPAHRNGAQGALQVVGVDGHLRIIEIDREPRAALARIGKRLGQGRTRQQALALELLLDPGKEALDERAGE